MSFGSQLSNDPNAPGRAWGVSQPTYQNGYQSVYTPSNLTRAPSIHDQFDATVHQITTNLEKMAYNFKRVATATINLGTPKDTEDFRFALNQSIDETNKLSSDTQAILKQLSALNDGTNEEKRERRGKLNKIQKDFDKFNAKFKEHVRIAKDRMSSIAPKAPVQQYQEAQLVGVPYDDEDEDEHARLLAREQDLLQVDNESEHMSALIDDRDKEIQSIQRQMLEVNEIMRDLAGLVHEQGDMIDNIELNIEHAHQNTEQAVTEVKKASEYQQKARGKMCLIAIILVVIVAIVVVVVVLVLR